MKKVSSWVDCLETVGEKQSDIRKIYCSLSLLTSQVFISGKKFTDVHFMLNDFDKTILAWKKI